MKVVLVGNYAPDGQQSMLRYAEMMRDGLAQAGCEVSLVAPLPVANRSGRAAVGAAKWLGYLDKYLLGTGAMGQAIRGADVVHVCDHSNAVYVPRRAPVPWVVTCHDLLAVRGALGEDTDCPASWPGRRLQHGILRGLARARAIACVSRATLRDAERLLGPRRAGHLCVIPNALNYPYRRLQATEVARRLGAVPQIPHGTPYLLLIGSNLRRKNREVAVRALARVADRWPGALVCAGEPLSAELRALAAALGIATRVIDVAGPDNATLEGLYNGARAMLFPSRFEGFGWPIIEAQACGCPVICSDRPPLPEVAGAAAIACDADDVEAFGAAILRVERQSSERERLQRSGLENVARFERTAVIRQLLELYSLVTRDP